MSISHLSDRDLLARQKDLQNRVSKYDNLQMARKIALNSLYGALG
jgi:hypothetical protein